MPYGTIKVDTVTFTNAGVDKSVTLSGLVQNPVFSGNVTVTGTLSGVTVTGTTANFTSGNFTNISGGTHTITSGVFAAGSAANPSITFTGDLNTGIYSPGADQVAISTGGSGRLFVDASGRVYAPNSTAIGPGTSTPTRTLQLSDTTGQPAIKLTNDTSGHLTTDGADLTFTGTNLFITNREAGAIVAEANGSERLRITSAGLVGVGTSSPSYPFHIANGAIGVTSFSNSIDGASEVGLLLRGQSGSHNTSLLFSSSNTNFRTRQYFNVGDGSLRWDTSSDGTAFNSRLYLSTAGNVGIGTTSPTHSLDVNSAIRLRGAGASTEEGDLHLYYVSASNRATVTSSTNGAIVFENGIGAVSERARIDSSGRLLVGTSSAVSVGGNFGATTGQSILVQTADIATYTAICTKSDGTGAAIALGKSRSGAIVSDGDSLGTVRFAGFDGTDYETEGARIAAFVDGTPGANDMPGRLVFSTTADGASSPTERLRITSAGLVGVGTSAPSYLLSAVTSDTSATTYVGQLFSQANPSGTSVSYLRLEKGGGFGGAIGGYLEQGVGSGLKLSTLNGGTLSEAVTITNTGRVGIGTASPGGKLQINTQDGFLFDVGAGAYAYMRFGSQGAGEGVAELANERTTGKVFLKTGVTGSTLNTRLEIDAAGATIINNQSGSERARIDSSGRLLVGTSSARANFFNTTYSSDLQVERASATTTLSVVRNSNDTGDSVIALGKTRGTTVGANTIVAENDAIGLISFQGSDGSNLIQCAHIRAFIDGTPGANDMPGRLVFSTTADGASSPTERMRITQDGSVLLNTGGNTIEVTTGTTTGAYYNNSGKQLVLARDGGAPLVVQRRSSDGTIQGFYRDGTLVGTISVTTTATAYNTSSDYRLKENVTPVTDGITRLQQLKPSRFNFIADPDKTVDGFLAHEVQTIVPEAITGEKDAVDDEGNPQYQGIDQSKLVPLLTAALQEAVAKIESLEARLTAAGI